MQAKRIATNIFENDFNQSMEKTVDELEEYFKSYSILTVIQGQIRLNPATKRNARSLLQFTKDRLRLVEDPAQVQFPIFNVTELI